MRQISNTSMQTLLRHLPRVLKAVEGTGDARLAESARLLSVLLGKLRRADKEARKLDDIKRLVEESKDMYESLFTIEHDRGRWYVTCNGERIMKIQL